MSGDCQKCHEHCLDCKCMHWHNVEKELPENKCKKYLVKTANGQIKQAFFMPDKAIWRSWYNIPTSYWLETPSAQLIFDVVEWSHA